MANIKDLLGDSYKDDMTAEEIVEALKGVSLPQDHSDEITRLKNAVTKANAEAAESKRALKSKMSEEEKKATEEAERYATMQAENEALKKQIAISDLNNKFIASGLDSKTAIACAEASYTGDIDTVINAFNAHIANVKETVKAELIAETPSLTGGSPTQVKDYSLDITGSLASGDFATAAALMRVAQEQTINK